MAVYALGLNPQRNGLIMMKADDVADPILDTEWTQVGGITFGFPMSAEIKAMGMKVDTNPTDTVIRVSYLTSPAAGELSYLYYAEFTIEGTNADTWTVKSQLINSWVIGNFVTTDVSYRSDGDIVVTAITDTGSDSAVFYVYEGTSWSSPTSIENIMDSGLSLSPPDGSDRVMSYLCDKTLDDSTARNILSNNSLGTYTTIDSLCDSLSTGFTSNCVLDSANLARGAYIDANGKISLAIANNSQDTPTWGFEANISEVVTQGFEHQSSPFSPFFLAIKNDDIHLFYVRNTGETGAENLYHNEDTGSGWSATDTTPAVATGTITRVSGSYFNGTDTIDKIGILYEDAGVTKFVYHDLGAVAVGAIYKHPIRNFQHNLVR